ncbi:MULTISPECIES: decaprenyl-phosphate phosphoribosyltransferase [unclassified Mesotoga]|jgi:4-hydroxybenzoate polyprenyltransferase|uniref:decaprenyl-phosphate phosphoribosyltransferase n=1 Tax=unclassified Mesotoga TaxID=1184398 RepID=UPI000AAD290B|nr:MULTISPECIES: decaprenyl-phosphate phosphoribosyltransferase [unclassified Mesotoga]
MVDLAIALRVIRIRHWIKNLFVFAPLIFSSSLVDPNSLLRATLIFVAFCLVSSSVYIFNDIKDRESDMHHARKKNRPIASGEISVRDAATVAAVMSVVAVLIALFLPYLALVFLLLYVVENIFYTLKGKEIVLIDAFCISAGFVIRVMAGAYAIDATPTGWIVVTTFFLSLFLGFGKRRNELLSLKEESNNHRKVLSVYDDRYLDYLMVATASVTIIAYTLYCLDPATIVKFSTDKLVYTVPFVTYGMFRYLLLLFKNGEGDPTEVVTRDRGIAVTVVLWLVSVMLAIYLPIWL